MPGRVVVVPVVVLLVAPLVFLAPHVLSCGPGCSVCPRAAARPLAVSAASFARRVGSKAGQAPPPPTGAAGNSHETVIAFAGVCSVSGEIDE